MIRVTCFGSPKDLSARDVYIKRIRDQIPFEWTDLRLKKNPDSRTAEILPEEEKFLAQTKSFVLLDVEGDQMTSEDFYRFCFQGSPDRHFVVGPAAGFPPAFRQRASMKLSLSRLTFTHGTAQLMLAESLYRSVCILKNHPFVK